MCQSAKTPVYLADAKFALADQLIPNWGECYLYQNLTKVDYGLPMDNLYYATPEIVLQICPDILTTKNC